MRTDNISISANRGKHITSHRELIILENGGVLIDNPGMREVGIADFEDGMESTFDMIYQLSENCKYNDCLHINEPGCAVIKAVKSGDIDVASYNNYLRMEKEKAHYESSVLEKKRKDKEFGKMVKNYKKGLK